MKAPLPLILARRELRAGARGFRILIACLALGVGTIAAVQSLSRDILGGIDTEVRAFLGGDLSIRTTFREATPEQAAALANYGAVSTDAELRGMARTEDGKQATLVEVKAVDSLYPLLGTVALEAPADRTPLPEALGQRNGVWGVAVEPAVLTRLGLKLGDKVRLGDLDYEIRGVVAKEPDRIGTGGFSLGPRFLMALDSLPATGLIQPGSLINRDYRILLRPGLDARATTQEIARRFPSAGWRVRNTDDTAPQITRLVTRLTAFMTLIGLTALLVGGVGVGNAVKAYLDGRIAVIATMKCLGASGRLIVWTYLIQVMALATVGVAIGLVIGALAPFALSGFMKANLPADIGLTLQPGGLALAAIYGWLIALAFSLWPIGRARAVPAASLFRDLIAPVTGRPDRSIIVATIATLLALIVLVLAATSQRSFTAGFAGGAVLAFAVLGAAARGLAEVSRRVSRYEGVRRKPTLRLALANLNRPGAVTVSVVLSLGLGLTILVAIAQVETDFRDEVTRELPAQAPAFVAPDVQKADRDAFRATVAAVPGVERIDLTPSLRGQIVGARGMPADQALTDRRFGWVLAGDQGLTYTDTLPDRQRLIAGEWWPKSYSGPPEVSVSREVAQGLGLKLGDDLTVSVVGHDVTAKVASIRQFDRGGLGTNFMLIFTPGLLETAPQTAIAAIYAPPSAETAVAQAVNDTFPGVTMIGVREALSRVDEVIGEIGVAVRLMAGVALAAGTLVLAGAVASGERRRIYDFVVLKVLGATRATVLRAFLIEHGLVGLMAAVIASFLGTFAAWAVIVRVMDIGWRFDPWSVAGVAGIAAIVTLGFGIAGTWRALGQRAAPLLRNE